MSKINLIPEVRQEKLRLHKLNSGVTTGVIVVAVVVVGAIIALSAYAGILTAQKASLNSQIQEVQDNLDTMKDLEKTVTNLEHGLSDIKNIVNGNKDWNKLLSLFEKYTPSDVQFTSLSVKDDVISASLRGSNIKSIDRFIGSFSTAKNDSEKNYFTGVSVDGYTRNDAGQYIFQSKFNLNKEVIW